MEPQKQYSDAEKLKILAQEVRDLLDKQKAYFNSKHHGSTPDQIKQLLQASVAQEKRIGKLADKILNPQATLPLK